MRLALALLLLFGAVSAQAQTRIQHCPGVAANSAYTACPKILCGLPTSESDIVLTRVNGSKIWKPLNTVPPTGDLVQCSVLPPTWTTRAQIGLKPPATPAPTPPASVGAGDVITWSESSGPVTGYRLYMRKDDGEFGTPVDVGLKYSWDPSALAPGKYGFAVTAYSADGESPKSVEIPKTIQSAVTPPTYSQKCTMSGAQAVCTCGP